MGDGRPELTRERAYEGLKGFFRDTPLLWFGTGPSCAVDRRFGMGALAEHLREKIEPGTLDGRAREDWERIDERLSAGAGLEQSLDQDRDLDASLVGRIERLAGDFVASVDREAHLRMLAGDVQWPLLRLIRRLLEANPLSRVVDAVTPNYDLLAEHSLDTAGIAYTTGFTGNAERRHDWAGAKQALLRREKGLVGKRVRMVLRPIPHVRLYKVHGSLSWFEVDGRVVETDTWLYNRPETRRRLVVAPGRQKYERTLKDRDQLFQAGDEAIRNASSFLFVGYGFNDDHLDSTRTMFDKLQRLGRPALIVTSDANSKALDLARDAKNVWLVCRVEEPGCDDTRVFNAGHAGWLLIPGEQWWDIATFTQKILGD